MESETKHSSAGVTFAVSEVARATEPLPVLAYADALAATLGHGDASALEAYSRDTKPLLNPRPHPMDEPVHSFIHAANCAYDQHRPLTLSPDMIWLLIAQGFALHVNANADRLRGRFVAPEGKAKITVGRDEFVRGFAGNDWESVFGEFSQQIQEHVGVQRHGLIMRRFSTTGQAEQAAFAVTLMHAFQTYFDYDLLTACGIPEITLEGSSEDWKAVRAGAIDLARQDDLTWWTKHLFPVLDQFVATSQGNVDVDFWREFYKRKGGSGGPYINGHVVNFFPYMVNSAPNPHAIESSTRFYRDQLKLSAVEIQARLDALYGAEMTFQNPYLGWRKPLSPRTSSEGMHPETLPSGLSTAPFQWQWHDKQLSMTFVAGFVGVAQDATTLALRPEIGWAVRERLNES